MTNSHKKVSGPPSSLSRQHAERIPLAARSHSNKKDSNNSSSHKKSTSNKKAAAKKAAWDDTNHDLSVHKLPMKKLLEKQLQMMSKETLCKIAGVEPPNRPSYRGPQQPLDKENNHHGGERDILSSPTLHQRERAHSRGRVDSFTSPTGSDGSAASSDFTSPQSHRSEEEEEEVSLGSTPSPVQQKRNRKSMEAKPVVAAIQHTVKPVVQKKLHAAPTASTTSSAAPARRSAAPISTTAPPKRASSSDDEYATEEQLSSSTSSFNASANLTYSPWLKQDQLLSPVLERSMENSSVGGGSVAGSPAAPDTRAQWKKEALEAARRREENSFLREEDEENDIPSSAALDNERQLLLELRQSIEQPSLLTSGMKAELESHAIAQAHATSLAPLLTRLASHLSEREGVAQKEAAFRATVAQSFAQAAQQVKSLVTRVDECEKENRTLKAMLVSQHDAHERTLQILTQQFQLMEQKVELLTMQNKSAAVPQMNFIGASAMVNTPATTATPSSSSTYDPTMYRSVPRPMTAPQAEAPAKRDSSPPRPIVIGHASRGMPQQPHSFSQHPQPIVIQPSHAVSNNGMQGQRLSEVQLLGKAPVVARAADAATHVNPAPNANKIAWQTFQNKPVTLQSSSVAQSPAPQLPTFQSSIASPSNFYLHDSNEMMESRPIPQPTIPHARTSNFRATPLSPGEEEDRREAERFMRESQEARAKIMAFNQQPHLQQQTENHQSNAVNRAAGRPTAAPQRRA